MDETQMTLPSATLGSIEAILKELQEYPEGSYMRCGFCGTKHANDHSEKCIANRLTAALHELLRSAQRVGQQGANEDGGHTVRSPSAVSETVPMTEERTAASICKPVVAVSATPALDRDAIIEACAKRCDDMAANGRKGNTEAGRHAAGALDMAAYALRATKGAEWP